MKKIFEPKSDYQACQIHSVHQISNVLGKKVEQRLPVHRKVKIFLKKRLGLNVVRTERKYLGRMIAWWDYIIANKRTSNELNHPAPSIGLKAGDWVWVRSEEEIRATLNHWNELYGCAFIDEMVEYCGTKQRIFKLVERFVDERDYKPKKVRGIVLLEGVFCNGTAFYGKCDRSCLYFWREEWLEKIGN